MVLIRRHSPSKNECSRVRSVNFIAVEHRGDVDGEQVVLIDHVVDLATKLTRDLEQVTFELLVDLRFDTSLRRRERLLGVSDAPASTSGGRHL